MDAATIADPAIATRLAVWGSSPHDSATIMAAVIGMTIHPFAATARIKV